MDLDPEVFKAFLETKIPFNRVLGLRLEKLADGIVVSRLPFADELIGDIIRPAIHGGAIAAMIDATAGAAAFTRATAADRVSTVDMRIDYLRPAPRCDLLATAEVRRIGKRIAVVNVVVTPEAADAEPVAEGRCVFNVKRNMGLPGLLATPPAAGEDES